MKPGDETFRFFKGELRMVGDGPSVFRIQVAENQLFQILVDAFLVAFDFLGISGHGNLLTNGHFWQNG